jgi:uroporphyrinogen-III synthase
MPNPIIEKTYALFANPNNKKVASEIENAGAKIIMFPPLETERVVADENSIEQLTRLAEFDWIIFPDVLAVDFFFHTLEENGVDFFELDAIRACALGEVVADRLRFAQLHADVIPNTIAAKEVLCALRNYIAAEDFEQLKFLLPKEVLFQNEIKNELLKTGAEVYDLPIYQIRISAESEISKLKALVKGGAIDEFIFSSPTDFIYLNYIFRGETLASVFAEIEISAVDGNVYQTAREHNLKRAGLFQTNKIAKVKK